MKLYSYWQSTTSYRMRAASNLKGVPYEAIPVDLVASEQSEPDYLTLNLSASVPMLVLDDGTVLTQSMAILDYIDATWPSPLLIPTDALARVRVLAVAHGVAMDIHPVNNLRLVNALDAGFGATSVQKQVWMQHWMLQGVAAIEAQGSADTPFAFGATPDLSDLCIISQMYNAQRREVPLEPFPNLNRITTNCLAIPTIMVAHPDNQPDAKETA